MNAIKRVTTHSIEDSRTNTGSKGSKRSTESEYSESEYTDSKSYSSTSETEYTSESDSESAETSTESISMEKKPKNKELGSKMRSQTRIAGAPKDKYETNTSVKEVNEDEYYDEGI